MRTVACAALALLLALGGGAALAAEGVMGKFASHHVLVAYFSRAGENHAVGVVRQGNTELVAEDIAALTGGELFRIEPQNPYPRDYKECTEVAMAERDAHARPPLAADVGDLSRYDLVFLGYPIWWTDLPMLVYTFLESHRWEGITVLPFLTHGGSGVGRTQHEIGQAAKGARVLRALPMLGEVAQRHPEERRRLVRAWLESVEP
ncbi:MAG: hypothetical protein K6A65_01895 [Succinivibrionaceae bacterium]|nr:hypothetical protein [Succinivibrionaceae bacterium]